MRTLLVVGLLAAGSAAFGATEAFSEDPVFVHLKPDSSSFWRTATGATMTLPVEFPKGAVSATLVVTGNGYSKTYEDITEKSVEVTLPAADSPSAENVYDLVLTFDDGSESTASLALIQGLSSESEGGTRCLLPAGDRTWNRVKGRAVLPVPAGAGELAIDGKAVETGLNGAQGWYALTDVEPGREYPVSLSIGEDVYASTLLGGGLGTLLLFR